MNHLWDAVTIEYEWGPSINFPGVAWNAQTGKEERAMSRIKRMVFTGLLAWALTFSSVPGSGEEKQESTSKKEGPEKSAPEKKTGKVQEEWQKVKKGTQEAGREFKESVKQLADSAKKESKETGGALKKAGREIKKTFREIFKGLKKLFTW
jgi:superfamily II DNA/RNA helicase